jgi:hypothetical protein
MKQVAWFDPSVLIDPLGGSAPSAFQLWQPQQALTTAPFTGLIVMVAFSFSFA